MNKIRSFNKYLYIILCVLVMIPSTLKIFSVSQTKFLSVFIVGIFGWFLIKKRNVIIKNIDFLIITLLVLSFVNIISLVVKILFDGSIVFNEIFDAIRYIIFAMLYLTIKISDNKRDKELLVRVLCICLFISAVVGISQFFNFLNLNELYIPKFAPTQYATLMPGYLNRRIIGLNSNPTIFGLNMMFGVLLNYIYYQFFNKDKKTVLIFISLIESVAIFMTNSRTTQIAFLVMISVLYFLYAYSNYGKKYALKHGFYAICILIITVLFILPNDLTWRLLQVLNLENVTSWTARTVKWDQYFEIIKDNFFIGVGPVKNLGIGYIDSEWIQILMQTGLVGFVSYVSILISPLYIFRKCKIKTNIYIALLSVIVLYNFASTTLLNYEVVFKFFILIALIGCYDNNSKAFSCQCEGTGNSINKKMCKKKLLVIATYFPPMGGVGVFRVSKFIKYLSKYGIEPTVITINKENYENLDYGLLDNIPNNINVYRINVDGNGKDISYKFYCKLKKNIKSIIEIEKPNHVFVTGGPFFILPIARYIYDYYSIKYTIDLRDPWTLQKRIPFALNVKSLKLSIFYVIENIAEKYSLSKAKNIVTVNDTMSEFYAEKYPMHKDRIRTITNGFDLCDFNKIKTKEKFNENIIIYTGKFNVSAGYRDPSSIFESMLKLREEGYNYTFVHVGCEDKKVRELANKFGVLDYCIFVGVKSYNETISYCKSSDILLVIGGTEKSEQTGKIFDYMGCKKRVLALCRQDGEIAKVCKDVDEFYTCEIDDIEKICSILKYVYDNELDFDSYQINKKYTREYIAEELAKLL